MKRVLILSYFFPPCSLTASQRTYSWAKELHKYGYYPIIVTRRWDHLIKVSSDTSIETGQEIIVEKHKNYEVHFLPYKATFRDLFFKYFGEKMSFLRKIFTLAEVLFQPIFDFFVASENIFKFTHQFLKTEKIDLIIVSGNPYIFFKLAYQINKKFNIPWIADYRDAWTTSEISNISKDLLLTIISKYESFFEKKWVSSASLVTATSEPIGQGITNLTNTKSIAIYNGFVEEDFHNVAKTTYEEFTISYIGTLYDGQKIEVFCNAFKKLIDTTPNIKIQFLLPGLAFHTDQKIRVDHLLKGYEKYYKITERIEKVKILEIEKNSHLLLHVAWSEHKGIIASKIYEYIASGTPIIVAPSDESSIDDIISKSKSGISTSDEDVLCEYIKTQYQMYIDKKEFKNDVTSIEIKQYSRSKQVEVLANKINSIV